MTEEDMIFWIFSLIITWAIAHVYYKRAHRDQLRLYKIMPRRVSKAVLRANKKKLSVRGLNKLLSDKTINKGSKDPLPFKACPECGSADIEFGRDHIVDVERGDDGEPVYSGTPYSTVKCNDCGWETNEIQEHYTLP